jgi:hypothetical protein
MRAIGFCHLLLQSRALVSRSFSTRSLPHARGLFRFPRSLPVPFFRRTEHSSTQRFHAAVVTVVDDRVSFFSRLPGDHRTTVVPVVPPRCAGLRIPPQRPTSSKLRLERCTTRSVKTSSLCDPARLPSEGYISSASVLRRLPRATGSRPHVASLSGFRWFCRQRAVSLRRFTAPIPRCVCKRDWFG